MKRQADAFGMDATVGRCRRFLCHPQVPWRFVVAPLNPALREAESSRLSYLNVRRSHGTRQFDARTIGSPACDHCARCIETDSRSLFAVSVSNYILVCSTDLCSVLDALAETKPQMTFQKARPAP